MKRSEIEALVRHEIGQHLFQKGIEYGGSTQLKSAIAIATDVYLDAVKTATSEEERQTLRDRLIEAARSFANRIDEELEKGHSRKNELKTLRAAIRAVKYEGNIPFFCAQLETV